MHTTSIGRSLLYALILFVLSIKLSYKVYSYIVSLDLLFLLHASSVLTFNGFWSPRKQITQK